MKNHKIYIFKIMEASISFTVLCVILCSMPHLNATDDTTQKSDESQPMETTDGANSKIPSVTDKEAIKKIYEKIPTVVEACQATLTEIEPLVAQELPADASLVQIRKRIELNAIKYACKMIVEVTSIAEAAPNSTNGAGKTKRSTTDTEYVTEAADNNTNETSSSNGNDANDEANKPSIPDNP